MYKIIGADGKEYGPISAEVVRQWIVEGRANGLTRALPAGATEWTTLGILSEFSEALRSMAAPSTPPPFSTVSQRQPGKTNSLALAGLILGILSITLGLCCCSGFPFSIPGLICSGMALSQAARNPQQEGRGMAIAGLVLSIAGLLIGILFMVLYGVMVSMPDVMHKIQKL